MTDQDAFDEWFAKRDVWPRITYDEVWHAALVWLRSQGEPVAWMLDGEIYEVKQHNLFGGDGEIPGQIPLFLAPQPAIPDGWKPVPIEPTVEMFHAGDETFTPGYKGTPVSHPAAVWAAMIATAPEPNK